MPPSRDTRWSDGVDVVGRGCLIDRRRLVRPVGQLLHVLEETLAGTLGVAGLPVPDYRVVRADLAEGHAAAHQGAQGLQGCVVREEICVQFALGLVLGRECYGLGMYAVNTSVGVGVCQTF